MASRSHASHARRLVAALALAAAASARGQTPGPIPVQTLSPAAPGSALFTVPDARTPSHLAPAAGLVLSYAHEPLVLERNGKQVPGGQLVREQLWGFAQASLGLGSRLRLDVAVPVALTQRGDHYFSSVPRVQSAGMGDLRLGLLASLARLGPVDVAAGLDGWVPTGSRAAYAGDGGLKALPKLVVGGEAGRWAYGAQAGVLLARKLDVDYARTGPGLAWGGGAAYRMGAFRMGPEAWGQLGLGGTRSPSEILLGGHWRPSDLDLGLAFSTALLRDAGAAPFRVVLTAAWRPATWPPARSQQPAEREPEPPPVAAAPPPLPAAEPPAIAPPAEAEPAPEPAAAPEPARPALPEPAPLVLHETVRFDLQRHALRPADLPRLVRLAESLAAHPEVQRVRVEGHTDSTGAHAFNRWLSHQRAEAVRDWLVEHGMAPGRIAVSGLGPRRPVATNATRPGRTANRRVEVVVEVQ